MKSFLLFRYAINIELGMTLRRLKFSELGSLQKRKTSMRFDLIKIDLFDYNIFVKFITLGKLHLVA